LISEGKVTEFEAFKAELLKTVKTTPKPAAKDSKPAEGDKPVAEKDDKPVEKPANETVAPAPDESKKPEEAKV
jgi:hypothetical protein